MKALISGGCGFVGSHLVDRLVARGDEVWVMDNDTSGNWRKFNDQVRNRSNTDVSRITLSGEFQNSWVEKKFDVIFHLAAVSRIPESFKDPLRAYEVNSTGTLRMLELARLTGARFVYTSTSCVHDGDVNLNPYSYTKYLGELHCQHYSELHNIPTTILRLFNVYGPREHESGPGATVVGIFRKQRREGKPLTITGDGSQRRDFIHVNDVVSALVAAGDLDGKECHTIEVGTGVNYSVNEVAAMFGGQVSRIPRPPGELRNTLASTYDVECLLKTILSDRLRKYIEDAK